MYTAFPWYRSEACDSMLQANVQCENMLFNGPLLLGKNESTMVALRVRKKDTHGYTQRECVCVREAQAVSF